MESPDDADRAATRQNEETDRFVPPDQTVPFLVGHSSLKSRAAAHSSEYQCLKEAHLLKSWPSGPHLLKERTSLTYASYLWDVIVTLFPVLFLGGCYVMPSTTGCWKSRFWCSLTLVVVLSVSALHLDNKPRSLFGHRIIEASKYGTTAFPIIFAVIIARLMRVIALWRCEVGSRLGVSIF